MAAEVGVKVESTGLACCGWDGWALRADEVNDEDEPDRQDVAIVVSRWVDPLGASSTPPSCINFWVTTGARRATERLSGGWRSSSQPSPGGTTGHTLRRACEPRGTEAQIDGGSRKMSRSETAIVVHSDRILC